MNSTTLPNSALSASSADDSDEIHLLDLLQVLADNLRLLILAPLAAGLLALGLGFALTPTFTASATFLPPQQQSSAAASMLQSLGALGGLAGAAAGIKNPSDQYVALMQSATVQNLLLDRFDLQSSYRSQLRTDARKTLASHSKIASGKDNIIKVEVEDQDPQKAADIANAYIEELGHLLNRLAMTEAQQRRVFFEKQLADTKAKLTQAQQALAASGVNLAALNTSPSAALEGLARLRAQVVAQEVKLASMRSYLTENAPPFKQAMGELMALKQQLTQAEQQQSRPDGQEGDSYISKYREYKYQETLFELFARQFELAKVDESREGAVIQVIDKAEPAERPIKPKKALTAIIAALATGFALVLFVFVRAAWRQQQGDGASADKMRAIRQSVRRALGRG